MSNLLPFFSLFDDAYPHCVVQSSLELTDRSCIFQRIQRIIATADQRGSRGIVHFKRYRNLTGDDRAVIEVNRYFSAAGPAGKLQKCIPCRGGNNWQCKTIFARIVVKYPGKTCPDAGINLQLAHAPHGMLPARTTSNIVSDN